MSGTQVQSRQPSSTLQSVQHATTSVKHWPVTHVWPTGQRPTGFEGVQGKFSQVPVAWQDAASSSSVSQRRPLQAVMSENKKKSARLRMYATILPEPLGYFDPPNAAARVTRRPSCHTTLPR